MSDTFHTKIPTPPITHHPATFFPRNAHAEALKRIEELGEEILAPLRKQPDAQPNAELLLELRKLQRAAHGLQVEKIALNQENEFMVRNFVQRLNEDMTKFQGALSSVCCSCLALGLGAANASVDFTDALSH